MLFLEARMAGPVGLVVTHAQELGMHRDVETS
jgi:hypothetical protein